MIEWKSSPDSPLPPTDQQILFRVRGEGFIRAGEYHPGDEALLHSGFEDMGAAEFFRSKRVSHWAPINFPK